MIFCRTRARRGESMAVCVVCQMSDATLRPGLSQHGANFVRYDCGRCGSFALYEEAVAALESQLAEVPLRRSLMSHTLRRMQRPDTSHLHILTKDDLPTLWRGRLPTVPELTDNLILWIGDNQTTPLTWVPATHRSLAAQLGMAIPDDGEDLRNWNW